MMHRIDTPTAQIDKFGQGKNGFTNGDPSTGRRATDLNSDMWDAVQEEMANAIEGNGIALDKSKHNQLYLAIQKAITDKGYLLKANNLSDLTSKIDARFNLDVYGKADGDNRYLQRGNNFSDITSKVDSRFNLEVYSKVEGDNRYLQKGNNLSDVTNRTDARFNLNVYSKTDGDGRYLQRSNNLSDLTSKPDSRFNLDVLSKNESYSDAQNRANKAEQNAKDYTYNNFSQKPDAYISENGWFRDKTTGLIRQWGKLDTTGGNFHVTLPMSFPSQLFSIQITVLTKNTVAATYYGQSLSGFDVALNGGFEKYSFSWEALGV
jgi:regulator of sigma D